ncbi:MAG: dTDP-4-dehydrorhamnose reductase [Betaproteobacteria bacterium HGW-Betaproteobacteria-2]|nr:MAG: dTDP-4-dehydrorhamnose reductase [Betaproteobacteria bacterium HGW-Betaproteobacteria-2]
MAEALTILLFGCNGQVGSELQKSLQPLGKVVALDMTSSEFCGDFTKPEAIAETIRRVKPDVIVNAAAYTAVDKAESEPELAFLINAQTPDILAQEAEKIGAWLIHYSTDYVFDGSGVQPWKETDTPNPLNVYGTSKLQGERNIAAKCSKHIILRTSWVFAAQGANFAKTMLRLAQERDALSVVDDQIGAPTGAKLLAELTANIIPKVMHDASLAGLYHAVAAGETSWYDYARFVIDCARKQGIEIRVKDENILPVGSDQFPAPAKRPANSRLDTSKLQQAFDIKLPDWQSGVEELLGDICTNR